MRIKHFMLLIILAALLAAVSATAGNSITTTVNEVVRHSGITFVNTPHGIFELDYEAGTEVTDKAEAYLRSIAGNGTSITFTWFPDMRAGQNIRVINKQSTASFAYR